MAGELEYLLVLSAAVFICHLGVLAVERHAVMLGLIDAPNHRSSHMRPTPRGGGLGIVLGSTGCALWIGLRAGADGFYWSALLGSVLVAAIGLRDDIRHVPAAIRLVVQLSAVGALVWSIPGVLPDGPAAGAWLWLPVLLIAGGWWINLFNFMDGIDGIAGSQAVFMLSTAAVLALWREPVVIGDPLWLWMPVLGLVALVFLGRNWPPARVFLGDVGSTYLAFVSFYFALATVLKGWLTPAVWLVLGALFAADASVTLLRRALRRQRLLEAHRSHAYQRLARRYGSHKKVTLGAAMINLGWLAPLAAACLQWPQTQWVIVILAYLPLVALAWVAGAGTERSWAGGPLP